MKTATTTMILLVLVLLTACREDWTDTLLIEDNTIEFLDNGYVRASFHTANNNDHLRGTRSFTTTISEEYLRKYFSNGYTQVNVTANSSVYTFTTTDGVVLYMGKIKNGNPAFN